MIRKLTSTILLAIAATTVIAAGHGNVPDNSNIGVADVAQPKAAAAIVEIAKAAAAEPDAPPANAQKATMAAQATTLDQPTIVGGSKNDDPPRLQIRNLGIFFMLVAAGGWAFARWAWARYGAWLLIQAARGAISWAVSYLLNIFFGR